MFPSVMVEQENFRQMSCVGDEIKGLLFAFFTLAVHKDAWVLAYWEAGAGMTTCWNSRFRIFFD